MYLEALPDDILLTIIQWLALSSTHPGHNQLPYDNWEHPLVGISAASRRLRQLAIPWLYRHIEVKGLPREMYVNNSRVDDSWAKAVAHVQGMVRCRGLMRHVRSFKFDFYIREGQCVPPPESRLVPRLVKLISAMTRLETLELQIEDHMWQAKVAPEFQRQFQNAKLLLPTVRTLVFSRYFEWLVFQCPNVRRIRRKDCWFGDASFDSLIKTGGTVKDLEYFEINAWQDERLALALVAAMPKLRGLTISGCFSFNDAERPFATTHNELLVRLTTFPEENGVCAADNTIQGLLQGLTGLKNLEFLCLGFSSISSFSGVPRLPASAEEWKKLCRRADDIIAETAFAQCTSLRTVGISQRVKERDGEWSDVDGHWEALKAHSLVPLD